MLLPPVPEKGLRVMSLNMQYAAGQESTEKRFLIHVPWKEQDRNLDFITQLIDDVNPDVVCLQEADKSSSRTDFIDQTVELVKRLEIRKKFYHHAFGSCINLNEKEWSGVWSFLRYVYQQKSLRPLLEKVGIEPHYLPEEKVHLHFGNAILSRHPILSTEHHFFTPPYSDPLMNFNILRRQDERKSFLICEIDFPVSDSIILMQIHNVHLENANQEARKKQAKFLQHRFNRNPHLYKIIAGDFNAEPLPSHYDLESETLDESLERLLRHPELRRYVTEQNRAALATHPSENPSRLIDTVLVSKHLRIKNYIVHPAPVSDHRAVIADITLID